MNWKGMVRRTVKAHIFRICSQFKWNRLTTQPPPNVPTGWRKNDDDDDDDDDDNDDDDDDDDDDDNATVALRGKMLKNTMMTEVETTNKSALTMLLIAKPIGKNTMNEIDKSMAKMRIEIMI